VYILQTGKTFCVSIRLFWVIWLEARGGVLEIPGFVNKKVISANKKP
jgi:hypothetical protein